jgi:hypothetical protein
MGLHAILITQRLQDLSAYFRCRTSLAIGKIQLDDYDLKLKRMLQPIGNQKEILKLPIGSFYFSGINDVIAFPKFQRAILKEALRVYEMIKRVLNEIEVQPYQSEQSYVDNPNLIFLESLSLRGYLPQEYIDVAEAEQLSTPTEIDTEISIQKTEDRPMQVTQIEPRDLEMLPDSPFTNLNRIEELIKGLKGFVQLLDKDFSVETLKFLRQIDASAVKEIFILGGRLHLGTDLKERCKAFINEMRNRGIVVEIRVLDAKDAQEAHDRYLIADGVA